MRVLIVDTWYARVLDSVYRADRGLPEQTYGEQWRALMATSFGTADSYSHYLGELGIAAHELIVNCPQLGAAWAREHGYRRRPWHRELDIVLAQADEFRPDVVYVQDLWVLPDRTLERLGRGRLLAGQIASEAPPAERLRRFDVILTSFPHFVERFRALGVKSEYFRIGFDPRVLDRLGDTTPNAETVFVGSLAHAQHDRGNRLLEEAARRVEIDFWGSGNDEWPLDSPIRRRHRGEAWGIDMLRVLARARIALNRHIDVAEGHANNMRLYEATGVGTTLITDAGRNLPELFEPGRELVTYRDADELAERISYYLDHEEERAAIGRAGQARTLAEHTYAQRMRELEGILERYLP